MGTTYDSIKRGLTEAIANAAGKAKRVKIPVAVYNALRERIEDELAGFEAAAKKNGDYVPFALDDYGDNPIALARIKANVTQLVLARRLGVTQAYISKVEHQTKVTPKLLATVKAALRK